MATLITGASAGLGEGFARALAAEKCDLLLTARRTDRLEALAQELRDRHGVTVHVFAADLAAADAPAGLIADITAAGLTIDTLINNAGFGGRGAFAEMPLETQLGQIDVNCRALVALSHAVLPAMIAAGRGGILNVASTAAFQPGPWMAVYYATKAFVLSFSEALHEEVKGNGIHVSALCPGPTRTEFADVAGMGDSDLFKRFASGPDTVVRDGLKALAANRAVKVSGAMNAAMAGSIRFTPRALARRIAGSLQKARS
ncbi:Short-chain dehydrogenase [Sphingomonas sp. EC-HK361]|uniref:SDR family NAD(P)-dependent oxidoreductase n=1 Tax=Sphingomonas sp. EC-HK361 TaxID=2038397 RepID=UPI001256888C|nr:SDR family oxidoreductase [Sphingomonas sp. EC-HK361]VVS98770.1 Short-chain dehydrogenase [Sphingomonas sp. EC-HK361]